MSAVTVYSSAYAPDPGNARDVLAFVLTPIAAFAPGGDDAELAAVAELLGTAKLEAVRRWHDLASAAQRS
jgi:hypothetical protein